MANTIDSGLNGIIIAQAVMNSFTSNFLPLTRFSTSLSDEAAKKGDTINVGYVGASSAAISFAGSYTVQDTTIAKRQVLMDVHQYVSWNLTDVQASKSPILDPQTFAASKGYQLAKLVFQNLLSPITAANYGAAAFTGLATTFDADDTADVKEACDLAEMPEGRILALKSSYSNALIKDGAVQDAAAFGNPEAVQNGTISRISGFDLFSSNLIPANAENLVGFAASPSALLIANRYLEPLAGSSDGFYQPIVHPETGLTLGYREFYDNAIGQKVCVLEFFGGKAVGEAAALKRLVSA